MEAGEILVRRGLIDPDQLEKSRQGVGEGTNVVNVAIDLGYVDEEVALRAMAEEVGLDFVDLSQADVDLTLLETFPTKLIYRQNLFPVARSNGQLEVATSDPFNLYPLDEASAATGLSVVPLLASRSEIDKLIKRHLGVGSETVDNLIEQQSDQGVELLTDIETRGSELSEMAQEASVIRLVNEILVEAANEREEAAALAAAMRRALEPRPGIAEPTAALVTPDRNLARRVVTELARYGIEANDSGG